MPTDFSTKLFLRIVALYHFTLSRFMITVSRNCSLESHCALCCNIVYFQSMNLKMLYYDYLLNSSY